MGAFTWIVDTRFRMHTFSYKGGHDLKALLQHDPPVQDLHGTQIVVFASLYATIFAPTLRYFGRSGGSMRRDG